jgi:glycolate oxidase
VLSQLLSPSELQEIRIRISDIVGESNVSTRISLPEASSGDLNFSSVENDPVCVVMPENIGELSSIFKFANNRKIPIVIWGGGSDIVSGGLSAPSGSILVSLRKMKRIVSADANEQVVVVEAGATIGELNSSLKGLGLWWPHDPESREFATVGGSISVNGIGTYFTRFGSAQDSILGLRIVLPNGEVANVGSMVGQSLEGYNLLKMFLGSEGTLCAIAEVTLRVEKKPIRRENSIFVFPSLDLAVAASGDLISASLNPETLIIEDSARFSQGLSSVGSSAPEQLLDRHRFALIISFSGSPDAVHSSLSQTLTICEKSNGIQVKDTDIVKSWWKAKTQLSLVGEPLIEERTKKSGSSDVSVPLSRFPEFYVSLTDLIQRHALAFVGTRAYINKNRDVIVSARVELENTTKDFRRFQEWIAELCKGAVRVGGTSSSIYGIGTRFSVRREVPEVVRLSRIIKRTLDPNNIMNPGKKVPI